MPSQFGGIEVTAPSPGGSKFGGIPVDSQPETPPIVHSSNAGISAEPEADGISGKLSRWARNVADDIKYGTDITGVGTVLKHLGAHGVYNGAPHAVGDYMAGLPLGLLKATEGAGDIGQGKFMEGAKKIASGGAQAVEMPLQFVVPEGVGKSADAIDAVIPSAKRAAGKFSEVMGAARSIPIDVSAPGDVALNIQRLSESGASRPKVIGDFLKRVTDPDKGALTYEEARDFYSNATRLSADENMRLTPVMKRQVGQFTAALDQAISGAAAHVGKLDQYAEAMDEYHKAMRLRALGQDVKDLLTSKVAATAAATGAGAAGAYAVKELLK